MGPVCPAGATLATASKVVDTGVLPRARPAPQLGVADRGES
jgi:hypothetical protein